MDSTEVTVETDYDGRIVLVLVDGREQVRIRATSAEAWLDAVGFAARVERAAWRVREVEQAAPPRGPVRIGEPGTAGWT